MSLRSKGAGRRKDGSSGGGGSEGAHGCQLLCVFEKDGGLSITGNSVWSRVPQKAESSASLHVEVGKVLHGLHDSRCIRPHCITAREEDWTRHHQEVLSSLQARTADTNPSQLRFHALDLPRQADKRQSISGTFRLFHAPASGINQAFPNNYYLPSIPCQLSRFHTTPW